MHSFWKSLRITELVSRYQAMFYYWQKYHPILIIVINDKKSNITPNNTYLHFLSNIKNHVMINIKKKKLIT